MVGILKDIKNLRKSTENQINTKNLTENLVENIINPIKAKITRSNIKNLINTKKLTENLVENIKNQIKAKNLTKKLRKNIITSSVVTIVKHLHYVRYQCASGDKVFPILHKKPRNIYWINKKECHFWHSKEKVMSK